MAILPEFINRCLSSGAYCSTFSSISGFWMMKELHKKLFSRSMLNVCALKSFVIVVLVLRKMYNKWTIFVSCVNGYLICQLDIFSCITCLPVQVVSHWTIWQMHHGFTAVGISVFCIPLLVLSPHSQNSRWSNILFGIERFLSHAMYVRIRMTNSHPYWLTHLLRPRCNFRVVFKQRLSEGKSQGANAVARKIPILPHVPVG